MALDIKAIVEKVITALKTDPTALENLKKDPIKTIETLAGVNLPDAQILSLLSNLKTDTANKANPTEEDKKISETLSQIDLEKLQSETPAVDTEALKSAASTLLGGLFSKK